METIARIRRDHLGRGVPIKQTAQDLKLSRNPVRKVVREDKTSLCYDCKTQPLPKLGPWVEELERLLEANDAPRAFTSRHAKRYATARSFHRPPASAFKTPQGGRSNLDADWGSFFNAD